MITRDEIKVVHKVAEKAGWKDYNISRESGRKYDLKIHGEGTTCSFSAWLPLVAIRELTLWTSPEVASLTDHPTMCEEGDWSGVRDSEPENIWQIGRAHV